MTSPVDFISGPSSTSSPGNFRNGKTGRLDEEVDGIALGRQARATRAARPAASSAAARAIGTPIAFETNGHRARGARVDLEDVELAVLDRELDVDEAAHRERLARAGASRRGSRRAARGGTFQAGSTEKESPEWMPGLLDVLLDAADPRLLAVAERVHVELDRVVEEAVDQDRVLAASSRRACAM